MKLNELNILLESGMSINEFVEWTKTKDRNGEPRGKDITFEVNGKAIKLLPDVDNSTSWRKHGARLIALPEDLSFKIEADPSFSLYVIYSKITSFKPWCPEALNVFYISGLPNITSLDGIPRKLKKLTIEGCEGITSLEGIEKYVDELETIDLWQYPGASARTIKSHLLGVLKIKGFKEFSLATDGMSKSQPLHKASAIVNKYVGQGSQGIIKCQRELIDADLDDFAEM